MRGRTLFRSILRFFCDFPVICDCVDLYVNGWSEEKGGKKTRTVGIGLASGWERISKSTRVHTTQVGVVESMQQTTRFYGGKRQEKDPLRDKMSDESSYHSENAEEGSMTEMDATIRQAQLPRQRNLQE